MTCERNYLFGRGDFGWRRTVVRSADENCLRARPSHMFHCHPHLVARGSDPRALPSDILS
jgi:hypothetical protein